MYALTLSGGDQLIGAVLCSKKDDVLLATKEGRSIRFPVSDIRPTGRQSQGVKGIRLSKKDEVIGMVLFQKGVNSSDYFILTATENGFAKRTEIDAYRIQSRGGKGITNIKISSRIGVAKNICSVAEDDEIMCITQKGILIRVRVKDIRKTGRSTQGVKIISLGKADKLSSVARIIPDINH